MKYISILKENPARENGYEIIGRRPMVKQDVIDYFKSIRPTRKEREKEYCELCGSLKPKHIWNGWKLCKFCYRSKVNLPPDFSTPDIEDLERFGLDKETVFGYTKEYKSVDNLGTT